MRVFMRAQRSVAHRVQRRRDAAQELDIHLMQTCSLEARVYRLSEFIVNAWCLDLLELFLRQVESFLSVVDRERFGRRGFVAEKGLKKIWIEDEVELAVQHGQRRDWVLRIRIAGDVVSAWKPVIEKVGDELNDSAVICLVTNDADNMTYPWNCRFDCWRFTWVETWGQQVI